MKTLDVVELIRPCFIMGSIRLMVDALPFELTEETFTDSVVTAMSGIAHAAISVLRLRKR